ncbi:MAG: hypothetical protein J1F23_08780 [Oscillospiraceae bacterium]|nr:hypothetical protein [Oscillospiraceae bacterium]
MTEIMNIEPKGIGKNYEEAFRTHQRIRANGEICAQALLEVCKDLKKMRDEKLYTDLGYETFDDYCENMAGIKSRMAYNYISVYERLGASVLQSNANLGITKLELIAGMNPIERTEKLASGEFENMSVSEIRDLIKKNREMGEQINLLENQLAEAQSEDSAEKYDAENEKVDELVDQVKELEEKLREKEDELRTKENEHNEELAAVTERIKAEMSAEHPQDNSAEIQKKIDDAVTAAKKETEKEVKAKLKEKSERQAEKIKILEAAIAEAGTEMEKLEKQLALSDTDSAKAMVYLQAIQDDFNALFSLISNMESEQQNKFKGAILKLTAAMQKKADE